MKEKQAKDLHTGKKKTVIVLSESHFRLIPHEEIAIHKSFDEDHLHCAELEIAEPHLQENLFFLSVCSNHSFFILCDQERTCV